MSVQLEELEAMKPGDPIASYGIFINITLQEFNRDKKTVTMRDRTGETKEVYLSLFLKHATLPNGKKGAA
jgi:hypothetical protein